MPAEPAHCRRRAAGLGSAPVHRSGGELVSDGGGIAGRRVAVLVSGSVAAYKACEVVSRLRQLGAEVTVAMTEAATRLVGPATFQALSGRPVVTDLWDPAAAAGSGHGMGHLALSGWAEVQVVVPASADVLARLALGLADDAVTTTALASRAPLVVAPAMETAMWEHPAVQEHVATLRHRGALVVGPAEGRLASGHLGSGRMAEPEAIVAAVAAAVTAAMAPDAWLAGRHVVVTAGGTREPIDPVRFVGNRSSGKMGVAVAEAALRHGAEVTLITAAPPPSPRARLRVVSVETAEEMYAAVRSAVTGADLLVMAAAVADYRSARVATHKLKKTDEARLHLELIPTVDILRRLRDDPVRQRLVVVGFAAETTDLIAHARAKLEEKGCDLIVANDVGRPDVGMGTDENEVVVVGREGVVAEVGRAPKGEVAERILEAVRPLLARRPRPEGGD